MTPTDCIDSAVYPFPLLHNLLATGVLMLHLRLAFSDCTARL